MKTRLVNLKSLVHVALTRDYYNTQIKFYPNLQKSWQDKNLFYTIC